MGGTPKLINQLSKIEDEALKSTVQKQHDDMLSEINDNIAKLSKHVKTMEVKEPIASDSIPSPDNTNNQEKIKPEQILHKQSPNTNHSTSIVDQIIKLSELKEKGMISEQEFSNIKKELIKKLR